MTQPLAVRYCRIVAPEKLSDRFLASGVLFQEEGLEVAKQVALAYVLEVTQPWFPSSRVLPSLLETLHAQHALLKPGKALGDHFEGLLRALNERLNAISEAGETDWIGNLNGLIMVISGDELHFSQTGRCPTYLLQNNRIRQITDEPVAEREPHPLKTFTNLASGAFQKGDYLLISNQDLYNEISLDGLRRIVGNDAPGNACQTIVKELKKEKNLGVSSIILQAVAPSDIDPAKEAPAEIILEDEMQSFAKKFGKKVAPYISAGKDHSVRLGKAGVQAAKVGGTAVAGTVAPAAATLLQKSTEQAAKLASKAKKGETVIEGNASEEVQEEAQTTPEVAPAIQEAAPAQVEEPKKEASVPAATKPEGPVVEIIRPRGYVEKKHANYIEGSLIPRDEFALGSSMPVHREPGTPILERIRAVPRRWMATPQSRRLVALTGAILLIGATGFVLANRKDPVVNTPAVSQTNQDLDTAEELGKKAATALELKQNVEAAREVTQGQDLINKLANLSEDQRKRADTIWDSLTATADALSTTTRFVEPVASYSFPGSSNTVVTRLPYFYGFSSGGNALLRSGRGDASATAATISLPDAGSSVVSVAKADDDATAAYLLTKENRIYRVLQNGTTTSLSRIQPAEGDFQTGDAIASYLTNVYLLDGKSGLLWRYADTGTSYAAGVSVIDNTKYNIKGGVSFAIDGSIFILKSDGGIMSFTRGVQDDFSLKNLPGVNSSMVQPLQIVTNADMDAIYVLDGGLTVGTHSTARVMQFTKDGTYVRQYAFPKSFVNVKGFDIDPEAKKLWITDGTKISEFNI